MRKRTITLLVMLAVLAAAVVSQAILFAVNRVTAENVITYGSLQMELHETDEHGADVPLSGGASLRLSGSPTQAVTRTITVKNICQENMYLRMRLSIGGTSADGKTFTLSDGEVQCAANESGGWQSGDDGWYYYGSALSPAQTTAALLKDDQLLFHTDAIARKHPNQPISLSVQVQAVQSKNNGPDARSAQGWPEEVAKP